MRVITSKSKNAESFYISKGYVNDKGVSTSVIVRKLGTCLLYTSGRYAVALTAAVVGGATKTRFLKLGRQTIAESNSVKIGKIDL